MAFLMKSSLLMKVKKKNLLKEPVKISFYHRVQILFYDDIRYVIFERLVNQGIWNSVSESGKRLKIIYRLLNETKKK